MREVGFLERVRELHDEGLEAVAQRAHVESGVVVPIDITIARECHDARVLDEEQLVWLEHEVIRRALEMPPSVISLGGGAVTREENRAILRGSGISVYLSASPETIFERVSRKTHRPLLAGLNEQQRMDRVRTMLAERDPYYRQADITVETVQERTPEQTAENVLLKLNLHPS